MVTKPGNQILSNALDIFMNTARISFGESQSKFQKISWFIDRNWFTQTRIYTTFLWLPHRTHGPC